MEALMAAALPHRASGEHCPAAASFLANDVACKL